MTILKIFLTLLLCHFTSLHSIPSSPFSKNYGNSELFFILKLVCFLGNTPSSLRTTCYIKENLLCDFRTDKLEVKACDVYKEDDPTDFDREPYTALFHIKGKKSKFI